MMRDDMDNGHWGFGIGHWELGILFWMVVFLVVAAMAKYLLISGK